MIDGDGLRIVRRELRIDVRPGGDAASRAQAMYDTSVFTLRVNTGIAGQPALLRPLDLAVPVRALDQPHIEAPTRARSAS